MRFSILPRVFSSRQAAKQNTNKPADNTSNEDGSATTDDESSTSSNTSTNGNKSISTNSSSSKSPPRKKYPLLSSSSTPSTVPSKALPVRIQFALSMFMQRPVPQNWSYLVSLLRGENMQRRLEEAPWPRSQRNDDEGAKRTLARLEKSLADELTVYEEEDDGEESLEEEREESTVEGDAVMELLAPNALQHVNSSAPTQMKRGGRQDSDEAEIDVPGSVAKTFIKRPSAENWDLLVQLFRNENRQRWDKDQPHEIMRVESDLTCDESLDAMERNNPKALSIIYESDEETDNDNEDDGEEESIVGIGLLPEMYNESDESEGVEVEDEEQKDELVNEKEEDDKDDDLEREIRATEESPEASSACQVDWPCSEEEVTLEAETAAAAVPSRAFLRPAPKATTRVPPSFANTRAKAYVLLWERRIRRFDQSQVNVVQKSVQPANVVQSTDLSMAPKAKCAVKTTNNAVASRKRLAHTAVAASSPILPKIMNADTRDEVSYHEEKTLPANNNHTPIVISTSSSSTTRCNNIVLDEVINWENKMTSIHEDVQHVLLGRSKEDQELFVC
eukprot:scaffold37123_cov128-Skeletonema_dohrnii-CCMP3373.AAC.7